MRRFYRYIRSWMAQRRGGSEFCVTDRLVGRGGHSDVLGGSRNGQRIAVKRISRFNSSDVPNELYALRTAETHRNIIHFMGYKEDAEFAYIAFELGRIDLLSLVPENGLGESGAKKMFQGMLSGVRHIHARGIVHRDIKLENWVMVKDTPKLIDFGLAHVYSSAKSTSSVLFDMVGSRSYCCPNVILQRYDGYACDVWSLAVCLFVMVAGFFPYDSASARDWRFDNVFRKTACAPKAIYGLYSWRCPFSDDLCVLLHNVLGVAGDKRLGLDDMLNSRWVTAKTCRLSKAWQRALTLAASRPPSALASPGFA